MNAANLNDGNFRDDGDGGGHNNVPAFNRPDRNDSTAAKLEESPHHIPLLPKGFFSELLDVSDLEQNSSNEDKEAIQKLLFEFRLELAKQYVKDAVNCQKVQVLPADRRQKLASIIYESRAYLVLFYAFMGFLMIFEPAFFPEGAHGTANKDGWIAVSVFLVLCSFDNLLGAIVMGPVRYYQHRWNLAYLLCIIPLFCDYWVNWWWVRSFRAVIIVAKSKSLRLTINNMFRTIPEIWQVVIIYLVIVTFYALLGMELLHGYYHHLDTEYTNCFSTFPRAMLTLFVLTTTENFPFVMYPPLYRGNPLLALGYFVSFLVIIVYLVMNMLLAAFYEAWKGQHERQLLNDRVRRYHALILVHHALLDDGTASLTMRHWKLLMASYRPEATPTQQKQMFRFLDGDDSGLVDLKELVLRGVDAMDYSFIDIELRKARATEGKGVRLDLRWLFCQGRDGVGSCCEEMACGMCCCDSWSTQHKRSQRQNIDQYFRREEALRSGGAITGGAYSDYALNGQSSHNAHTPYVWVIISARTRMQLETMVSKPKYVNVIYTCIVIHSILLITVPWPYPFTAAVAENFLTVVFVLDQLVKIVALPSWKLRGPKLFDLVLTVGMIVSNWVLPVTFAFKKGPSSWSGNDDFSPRGSPVKLQEHALRVQLLGRIAFSLRLLSSSKRIRDVIETIGRIRHILYLFMVVFFLIIYVYACIGVALFKDVLAEDYVYDADDDDPYQLNSTLDDAEDVLNSQVYMGEYYDGLLNLFQIATTNNWQDIMYANVLESGTGSNNLKQLGYSLYFVSFFVVMVWFGTNTLTALVIDVYEVAGTRKQNRKLANSRVGKSANEQGGPNRAGHGRSEASGVRGGRRPGEESIQGQGGPGGIGMGAGVGSEGADEGGAGRRYGGGSSGGSGSGVASGRTVYDKYGQSAGAPFGQSGMASTVAGKAGYKGTGTQSKWSAVRSALKAKGALAKMVPKKKKRGSAKGFDPLQDPLISSAVGLHDPNASDGFSRWSPPRDGQQHAQQPTYAHAERNYEHDYGDTRRWAADDGEHEYGDHASGSPERVRTGSDTPSTMHSVDGTLNVRDDWQEKQELTGFALNDTVAGFNDDFRPDQDLLSPQVLNSLRFMLNRTCARFMAAKPQLIAELRRRITQAKLARIRNDVETMMRRS